MGFLLGQADAKARPAAGRPCGARHDGGHDADPALDPGQPGALRSFAVLLLPSQPGATSHVLFSGVVDPWYVLTLRPCSGYRRASWLRTSEAGAGGLLAGAACALSILALLHLFQTLCLIGLKDRRRAELLAGCDPHRVPGRNVARGLWTGCHERAIEGLEIRAAARLVVESSRRTVRAHWTSSTAVDALALVTAQALLATALVSASRRAYGILLRTETATKERSGVVEWRVALWWRRIGGGVLHVRLWTRCVGKMRSFSASS